MVTHRYVTTTLANIRCVAFWFLGLSVDASARRNRSRCDRWGNVLRNCCLSLEQSISVTLLMSGKTREKKTKQNRRRLARDVALGWWLSWCGTAAALTCSAERRRELEREDGWRGHQIESSRKGVQSSQGGSDQEEPTFVVSPLPQSVVGHDGQSAQLAELGLRLPLPLLVRQPCLVDLIRQLAEDLVHLGEIDHLEEGGGKKERGLFS